MNYLIVLGQLLSYATLLGLFTWGIKSAVSFYVFSRRKEAMNKLNARISILKMHLKTKIKRKSNKIDIALKKDPEVLSLLAPKLKLISTLEFSSPADYQVLISNLFLITEEIIGHIKIKHKALIKLQKSMDDTTEDVTLSETDLIADKCKKLVKYDKAHILIIIDIIAATDELIEKIAAFNELVAYEKNQKKITIIPEKIQIEHYDELAALVEKTKHSDIEMPDFPILEKDLDQKSA